MKKIMMIAAMMVATLSANAQNEVACSLRPVLTFLKLLVLV